MKAALADHARILICRTGAMGDVLHALPAVAALRRARPHAHIGWVVDPRWDPLLTGPVQEGPAQEGLAQESPALAGPAQRGPEHEGPARGSLAHFDPAGLMPRTGQKPLLDRVHRADTRLWSRAPFSAATLRSLLELRKELQAGRYDLAVDLQGTLRSAVIARMSRAAVRAGYADPREPLAASFYTLRQQRHGTHVVKQGAHLLGDACGLALQPGEVDLPHAAWADDWAAELVREQRLCVLSPSAGWGAKRWPAARFGALAQKLHGQGLAVRVNAARADDTLAQQVVAASQGTAQIVVCNVAGLTALLRRTALLVGGDSGPLHLAAALAVPLVALFGPTDPARNGPWGQGPRVVLRDAASQTSYRRRDEIDPGLAQISVETVWDAACKLL